MSLAWEDYINIANEHVAEGKELSDSGTWLVYTDEIEDQYGVAIDDKMMDKFLMAFEINPDVLEVELDDNAFSLVLRDDPNNPFLN